MKNIKILSIVFGFSVFLVNIVEFIVISVFYEFLEVFRFYFSFVMGYLFVINFGRKNFFFFLESMEFKICFAFF